jgi:hypothetical protein
LGFFVFVINGISLWLASAIADKWFHVGFYVDGFWAALISDHRFGDTYSVNQKRGGDRDARPDENQWR